MNRKKYKLQTKIGVLVFLLLLLVIVLANSVYAWNELRQETNDARQLALQTSRSVAGFPAVEEAFENGEGQEADVISEQIRTQVNADRVYIINRNSEIIAGGGENLNPDARDAYTALVFGGSYVREADKGQEGIIRSHAPVSVDYGDYTSVEGAAVVEYSKAAIRADVWRQTGRTAVISLIVLMIGAAGTVWLSRSIRSDTLGLEPYQIAELYRDRAAIISSVQEGIIAVDNSGRITMVNRAAEELLQLPKNQEGLLIDEVFLSPRKKKLLEGDEVIRNEEIITASKTLIVNESPIAQYGNRIGRVFTFRDKTDMKQMIEAFSDVKKYSDDLRAQSHEFTNKLYALMGLLQLGYYTEAEQMLREESKIQQKHTKMVVDQIKDEKLQAVLLGKAAAASEKKTGFTVDSESSLEAMPEHVTLTSLIIIAGNLIDNAMEAVNGQTTREVSFFVTDIGKDIVMEVKDNGPGMPGHLQTELFQQGTSSKGEGRGYGMTNVKNEVDELGGMIEVYSNLEEGTVISVFIPKEIEKEESRDA
ncbi:sensor histidine kinase [Marinococcus halophilus]|uniref:sensor histidine kinase n=1 Tax=Marinococcus halophilus TaxID=1371 RepID=UPI0009A730C1|nr:sensor histidine kinase [Marinococcus halophilus]